MGFNFFWIGLIVGVTFIPQEASLTRMVHGWYDSAHEFTSSVWYQLKVQQGLAAPLLIPSPVAVCGAGAISTAVYYYTGQTKLLLEGRFSNRRQRSAIVVD